MKWLAVLISLLWLTACVSPAEKAHRAAVLEQRHRDWLALTPAQRIQFQMMQDANERQRRLAVAEAMQNFGNSMQQAAWENQQRYEATRPRTYHVRDNGFGNVTVTPAGY